MKKPCFRRPVLRHSFECERRATFVGCASLECERGVTFVACISRTMDVGSSTMNVGSSNEAASRRGWLSVTNAWVDGVVVPKERSAA
jgi:hypothetical protein